MRIDLKAFWLALVLVLCPAAAAANLEIKSENIVFYGDVRPEDGKRLVRNLEIYRSVILALSEVKNRPDPVPLRIYAFENGKKLNQFASSRGAAGLYLQASEGPIFLTVSSGGFRGNKWSSQVAFHEYSHHVLHALSKDVYPRWYDEGFANYLSTFNIVDDVITIGAPNVSHGRSIKNGALMDPETILKAVTRYPATRRLDKFYGQSWLYVHYLQNTPELSEKLPVYLKALKDKTDALEAFEQAFGLSIQEFHKRARLYWNKNTFPVASFKASPALLKHDVTIAELSDAQFELAYAKAQLSFLRKKDAAKFEKKLAKIAPTFGENAEFSLLQAEAAMINKDYERARSYLSKAIRGGEMSSHLLRLRGDIIYQKLWSEQFGSLEKGEAKTFKTDPELMKAVKYFEDALTLDSSNKTSNLHLLSLLGRSNAAVSAKSLKAVERSYERFLNTGSIGEYLSVANVMARTGKPLRACDNYRYAKGRIDGYEDKDINDDFARLERFEQSYPNICEN